MEINARNAFFITKIDFMEKTKPIHVAGPNM